MQEYKPKPIKGLKITHKGTVYDKIVYVSCSNEGISFENMPNENTTINIRCAVDEATVSFGGD